MKWFDAAFLALALCATPLVAAAQAPMPMNHRMAATAPSSVAPAEANTVRIDNFAFGPQTLTVPVGTTVTWVNRDDAPHTVVANAGAFRSKVLDTDDRFSFTFTTAGEYAYFCSLHPHMTGKVIVEAK